ncbi:hypothetical protein OOU_Y34scaffold00205g3 [Pyricularia oryzae Y34]|uniref:Uncharacterized protein n=2 Tax=Pyricularia oryzae TaxID=318829 RepID=A0AA97P6C4_PYRO3|nr:hypothetical protein OOU_Y34scaffold00205g3 [Pyricularia oryzae Y34]
MAAARALTVLMMCKLMYEGASSLGEVMLEEVWTYVHLLLVVIIWIVGLEESAEQTAIFVSRVVGLVSHGLAAGKEASYENFVNLSGIVKYDLIHLCNIR